MKFTTYQRTLVKLALRIHQQLVTQSSRESPHPLPEATWERLRRHQRCCQLAHARLWSAAHDNVLRRLRNDLDYFLRELQTIQSRLGAPTQRTAASAHDIYRDLVVLEREFDQVRFNSKDSRLSVTTESITLEGQNLGPFEIEVDLRRLLPHPEYTVTALAPHPAGTNSEVHHPHVQEGQLCEGEGTMAIRSAVQEGRLLDFLLIVRNLLHTYNPASPYVALEDWDGRRCSDCDVTVNEDGIYRCERCETSLCEECVRLCGPCGESTCSGCGDVCSGCDDDLCRHCRRRCPDCHRAFCQSCLQTDETCLTCHETNQEQAAGVPSDAALQSL